eukprot:scaffold25774_cov21-Tisochrysis_lutea.AAC.1
MLPLIYGSERSDQLSTRKMVWSEVFRRRDREHLKEPAPRGQLHAYLHLARHIGGHPIECSGKEIQEILLSHGDCAVRLDCLTLCYPPTAGAVDHPHVAAELKLENSLDCAGKSA